MAAFKLKRKLINIDVGMLKRFAKQGQIRPDITKVNPHKVIIVASGTTKILAKTVTGEMMRKLRAIIPSVPSQAENETRQPSQINLHILTLQSSKWIKALNLG